ncbi:unnamed protein product [Cylindrotheca closterium]|uniref:Uncharacterized protein n=1 Tax=Cylindrotheca closterium TaxID=2856 RepID=A0AAD2G4A9_9STRA|nr:unnamed protein product [Cylindrotheca closterium]
MSGLNLSQVPKKPREWPSSRSGSSANKNKNRVATRRKHQERELKPLKNKLKFGIRTKEGNRSTRDSKAILEAKHNLCVQQIRNEMKADYEEHNAFLIARCMMQIKAKFDTDEGRKIHRYLGMTLDFLVKGKLKILLEDFPIKFNKDSKQKTPAGNDLLEAGKGKLLSAEYPQIFCTTVARGLYVSKRARLDIHPKITILASRVRENQVEKGNVKIEYCPTDNMIADFMTKPLQGEKFRKFRDLILGPQE